MIRVISEDNYKRTLRFLNKEIERKKKNYQKNSTTSRDEIAEIEYCIGFVKLIKSDNQKLKSQQSLF